MPAPTHNDMCLFCCQNIPSCRAQWCMPITQKHRQAGSGPAWSTRGVPDLLGLHSKALSLTETKNKTKPTSATLGHISLKTPRITTLGQNANLNLEDTVLSLKYRKVGHGAKASESGVRPGPYCLGHPPKQPQLQLAHLGSAQPHSPESWNSLFQTRELKAKGW